MTKDDWCMAFEQELVRLRPHIAPSGLTGRLVRTVALQQHQEQRGVEPKVAAQRYHAASPRPKG